MQVLLHVQLPQLGVLQRPRLRHVSGESGICTTAATRLNCSPLTTLPQAEGRDAAEAEAPPAAPPHSHGHPAASWQQHPQHHPGRHPQSQSPSTEICVPQAIHGVLRYTVMEIIPTEEPGQGAYWVLRQKAMAPRALPYSAITTSDTPRAVMASVGVMGGQMAY